MKYLFPFLSLAFLASCSPITADNLRLISNFDAVKASTLAQIGKATNCDILKTMKQPYKKIIYGDNQFSYYFRIFHKAAAFTFEDNVLCGAAFFSFSMSLNYSDGEYDLEESKSVCSANDWNDDLSNKWKDSKYKFVDMPQEPEVDVKDLDEEEFLQKIVPGMKKGALFRIIGKPEYSYEEGNREKWKFVLQRFNTGVDMGEEYIPGGQEFVIVLENNAVAYRYVRKVLLTEYMRTRRITSILDEEEKRCTREP